MIIVDRIINGFAVCEKDGNSENIPLSIINGDVKEGVALLKDSNGDGYTVDTTGTDERRKAILQRYERIKSRSNRQSKEESE